jgi:archaellum component FlaG (FlaF/FlaG flagellin family)
MSSDVGNISSSTGIANAIAAVAPELSVDVAVDFSASVATTTTSAADNSTVATTLINNPRIVQDPSAGLITEYLSANGSQIVSQTPNAVTVAYLRQGLTADGLTKPPAYQPVTETA